MTYLKQNYPYLTEDNAACTSETGTNLHVLKLYRHLKEPHQDFNLLEETKHHKAVAMQKQAHNNKKHLKTNNINSPNNLENQCSHELRSENFFSVFCNNYSFI